MSTSAAKQTIYKLPHATKLEFLHIYRHLLREATYLPDKNARDFWWYHIVSRFRSYSPRKSWSTPITLEDNFKRTNKHIFKQQDPTSRPISSEIRANHLLNSSRMYLRLLARANEGVPSSLEKALCYTYGRLGPRKHKLIEPLLVEIPKDDTALEKVAQEAKNNLEVGPNVPPALLAVANSQRRQKADDFRGNPIKVARLDIPKTNAFGRPMPLKRVRNMKLKHMQELKSKVMPPLPLHEWEKLGDLANGRESWSGQRLRRKYFEKNLHHRVAFFRRRRGVAGPRQITARGMRRLWGRIYVRCSLLAWNESAGKYRVTWGSVDKPGFYVPDEDGMRLFEVEDTRQRNVKAERSGSVNE